MRKETISTTIKDNNRNSVKSSLGPDNVLLNNSERKKAKLINRLI